MKKASVSVPESRPRVTLSAVVGTLFSLGAFALIIASANELGARDHVAALILFLAGAALTRVALYLLRNEIQE